MALRFIDRLATLVIGLVLIGVITIVAVAPEAIRSTLAGIQETNVVLRVAVVVVLNVLTLIALFLALRSPRKVATGLAVQASGAYTDVSVESARKLILNAVEDVQDVVKASATVKAVNGKADVDLDVQVMGADINIPRKQKEIDRALRQVIKKQLGLQMRAQPRVHIFLKGEEPPASLAAPEPVKLEANQPLPEPEPAALAKSPVIVPASDDDDTLLKEEETPKDEKPLAFLGGILGHRTDSDDEADSAGPDALIEGEGGKDEQTAKDD